MSDQSQAGPGGGGTEDTSEDVRRFDDLPPDEESPEGQGPDSRTFDDEPDEEGA